MCHCGKKEKTTELLILACDLKRLQIHRYIESLNHLDASDCSMLLTTFRKQRNPMITLILKAYVHKNTTLSTINAFFDFSNGKTPLAKWGF